MLSFPGAFWVVAVISWMLLPGTTQDKDMLFPGCETTRIQYLHHLMLRQHTCSKWAQQHVFDASFVGVAGPCGSTDVPKDCTAHALWQEHPLLGVYGCWGVLRAILLQFSNSIYPIFVVLTFGKGNVVNFHPFC